MSDQSLSNLQKIIIKVRMLTKNPSSSSITDNQIMDYINTFILYDFPLNLNLESLKTTLAFYTSPNKDIYHSVGAPITDPLYNFSNKYLTVETPVYVAGNKIPLYLYQDEFYNDFPQKSFEEVLGTGNGITTNFTGTLSNFPILENNAVISSINNFNGGMALENNILSLFTPNNVPTGIASTLNPETGAYVINFDFAPRAGADIVARTVPIRPTIPQALLYFDNVFTVRPVPDQAYKIELQVTRRPTELLNAGELPELSQWWQYIAYGAAKKIFEDRMDIDSVQMIMPEMMNQETLINRKQIRQNRLLKVKTIYDDDEDDLCYPNRWF